MPIRLRGRGLPPAPILRYYAFETTRRASFSVPVFVLFFTDRGLSLAQVGLLEALWTVVVLGFETPTGYLGDRFGRRWSLLVGTALTSLGALAFVFARSFAAFAAVVALRGVAATLTSGTREAWLYDTLREHAEQRRFAHHSGRASAVAALASGGAAVAGGALYTVDHALPWVAEAVVVASGALVLLTVRESTESTAPEAEGGLSLRRALALARDGLSTRGVGAAVLYTAVLFGVLDTLEMYVQPASTDVLGADPANLGLLYAGFTAVSAVAVSRSGWLESRVGVRRWFRVAPAVLAVALVVAAFRPVLVLPAFVLARGVGRASRPLFGQYVNDRTTAEGRATVLSAAATVRSLATAPLNALGGALVGPLSVTGAMAAAGVALLAAAGFTLTAWPATPSSDVATAAGDD